MLDNYFGKRLWKNVSRLNIFVHLNYLACIGLHAGGLDAF